MNTYEAYLTHPAGNVLKMEEALQIYTDMVNSIQTCTLEDKMDFWNDFIKRAAKYTQIRCAWETMSREERMEADSGRTAVHDGVITALNILARIVTGEGGDSTWREKLGRTGNASAILPVL